MTTTATTATDANEDQLPGSEGHPYERMIQATGVPIIRGYFIEDARTVPLGRWDARECDGAFIQMTGQQGVSGVYLTEVPAGKTSAFFRTPVDESIYVLSGRGVTTVKSADGSATKSFEWGNRCFSMVPAGCSYQITNMQGDRPARLLHINYLPMAMGTARDPLTLFGDKSPAPANIDLNNFYGEASATLRTTPEQSFNVWSGNFFPDLGAWDRLDEHQHRGAGGRRVYIEFPGSPMTAHMSVFPPLTYKKAHRHGPSVIIVIPAGEGYSVMWPDGGDERVIVPWHEGSMFVPLNRWFHQHFNVGGENGRYLAIHSPAILANIVITAKETRARQLEYPDENPWIRQKFESELAQRGLKSVMVDEAYKDRDYKWATFAVPAK